MGPDIGFAILATRRLACDFPSQVTGDHAAGGLGDCERSGDSSTVATNGTGLPEKAARPPGSALGRPRWWVMASPGYSSPPQEPLLEVTGGAGGCHGGDSCPAPAYGRVETSAATPYQPRPHHVVGTGALGHHGAHLQRRPWEATPRPRSKGCTCFLKIVLHFFFLVEAYQVLSQNTLK